MIMQRNLLALLLILLACLAPVSVFASACSNPNGNEGDIVYNHDYHTPQFCNGSGWYALGAAGGSGGPMLISTQTASSSASLQFTNLPTSYNTLFLNCSGLLETNADRIWVEVGEGAGPTWETAAHYTVQEIYVDNGGSGSTGGTSGNDLTGNGYLSSTQPLSLKMYIDDVASSSIYKYAYIEETQVASNGTYLGSQSWSYWNNDTNPITGFEILPASGTFSSGQCSLYGMN